MSYCVVENNTIVNIIECANDAVAASFNALPGYEDAKIGDTYAPPSNVPEAEPTVWDEMAAAYKEGVQEA